MTPRLLVALALLLVMAAAVVGIGGDMVHDSRQRHLWGGSATRDVAAGAVTLGAILFALGVTAARLIWEQP